MLFSNTTGFANTAEGAFALEMNTTGSNNTALGHSALLSNTTANDNTAVGSGALTTSTGVDDTAVGSLALQLNSTGNNNTAMGASALMNNSTGSANTGLGFSALLNDTTGSSNTAVGINALLNNTTGASNIAIGNAAGSNLTTGTNNIDIGAAGTAGESKKIRIGTKGTQTAAFIAGINGVTVAGGVSVIVNSNGQLGTVTSSARYKEDIQPMDKASKRSSPSSPSPSVTGRILILKPFPNSVSSPSRWRRSLPTWWHTMTRASRTPSATKRSTPCC